MKGWHKESYRHYLAAKGIKTNYYGGREFQKSLEAKNIHFKGTPTEQKQLRQLLEKQPELIKDLEGIEKGVVISKFQKRRRPIPMNRTAAYIGFDKPNSPSKLVKAGVEMDFPESEQELMFLKTQYGDEKLDDYNMVFRHEVGHIKEAKRTPFSTRMRWTLDKPYGEKLAKEWYGKGPGEGLTMEQQQKIHHALPSEQFAAEFMQQETERDKSKKLRAKYLK